jgi:hypothetical protein
VKTGIQDGVNPAKINVGYATKKNKRLFQMTQNTTSKNDNTISATLKKLNSAYSRGTKIIW